LIDDEHCLQEILLEVLIRLTSQLSESMVIPVREFSQSL
jgi:hypothetical protein